MFIEQQKPFILRGEQGTCKSTIIRNCLGKESLIATANVMLTFKSFNRLLEKATEDSMNKKKQISSLSQPKKVIFFDDVHLAEKNLNFKLIDYIHMLRHNNFKMFDSGKGELVSYSQFSEIYASGESTKLRSKRLYSVPELRLDANSKEFLEMEKVFI